MAQAAPVFKPIHRGKDGLNTFDRLTRSRIVLLTKYPFFGNLALHLELEEVDPSSPIKTAATDGFKFYYNADFIDSLDDAELNWVMCHEVMHPALGHLWRRGTRTHTRFNHAADYAIHDIMQEMHQKYPSDFRMPTLCLYDAKYHNMSSEEIYEALPSEEELKLKGGGLSGQGTLDSHDPWDTPGNDGADGQAQEQEWQGRVVSAAQAADQKMKGDMPAGIKRMLGKITKPQKNWKQLLAEFVQFEISDYAFTPPDRRLYGMSDWGIDVLLPDYSEETSFIRELIFAIDTSGSIWNGILNMFISEGVGLLNQYASKVTGKVVYCDAYVAAVYPIEEIGERPPAGGGGTSFVPVFDWIEKYQAENNVEVCGLVYLTDCYGDFPKKAPSYPVLWVSCEPLSKLEGTPWYPPFGQTTEIKMPEGK